MNGKGKKLLCQEQRMNQFSGVMVHGEQSAVLSQRSTTVRKIRNTQGGVYNST